MEFTIVLVSYAKTANALSLAQTTHPFILGPARETSEETSSFSSKEIGESP
jgi:hypothetical protein